jgi:hypothetical protein
VHAILGKITGIRRVRLASGAAAGSRRLEVSFHAACVMPGRTAVPPWLAAEELRVVRDVPDPREVGSVGDSIALSPVESARWLEPLLVEPSIAHGEVPEALRVCLRWWRSEEAPACTVGTGAGARTVRLVRDGPGWSASVRTTDVLGRTPSLPARVPVAVDGLEAECTVLPPRGPFCCRVGLGSAERHRAETDWYAVEFSPERGGLISMLRERGRDIDHFRSRDDLVGEPIEFGGHEDRVMLPWDDPMGGYAEGVLLPWDDRLDRTRMEAATCRREGEATRLHMEGVVDRCRNLRTSVSYSVFHCLPIVLVQRDLLYGGPTRRPGDDAAQPREVIDDVQPVMLGCRSACHADAEGRLGGRVLSVDGERFAVLRHAEADTGLRNGWRPAGGWTVVEHPERRECLMYIFDEANSPVLDVRLGAHVMMLEPRWLTGPVRPGGGAGFATALCAGEFCGATTDGAWVALRRPADDGLDCAVVGRWRHPPGPPVVAVRVGRREACAPLERLVLPGVGPVHVAVVHVREAGMHSAVEVTAGGIAGRAEP